MKRSLIFVFWGAIFIVSAIFYSQYSFKISQHQTTQASALILKGMSESWLRDAQMDKRIHIKSVDITKTDGKIAQVKIELQSNEHFQLTYRQKLIHYLNIRGKQETGQKISFLFESPPISATLRESVRMFLPQIILTKGLQNARSFAIPKSYRTFQI